MIFEHDTKDHGGSTREPKPSPGQIAYEEDCRRMPHYGNAVKTPRLAWHELPEWARRTWELDPTPRNWNGLYHP